MIDLQLLGTTALLDGDRPDLPRVLAQPKRLALFAYLTLATPRDFHRRDKLLGLFWPERTDAEARAALSNAVYFLRKRLGGDVIVSRGSEEVAIAGEQVRCDALEFERAVEEERFADAVALYSGDLLDGFHLAGSDEFERWLESERTRLRAAYARALEAVAAAQERDGAGGSAVESWRRLRALDPYDSRYALRLVQSLARMGRPAAALREAEAHSELLRSELGMEPPEELAELVDRLRTAPVRADLAPESEADVARATEPPGVQAANRATESPAEVGRSPRRRPRPWAGRGGAAVLIAIVLVAGTYLTRNGSPETGASLPTQGLFAADAATTSIAVLPFTVRGDPDLAYLREGMVTLLSTKLDGAGDLRSVDSHALLGIAGDQDSWEPHQAGVLAADLGAGLFVVGDVVAIEGNVHLAASLLEPGTPLPGARAAVEGAREDLLSLIDRLAVELLATRLRQPEAGLPAAADLTTHSLPALRAFLEGERERRAFRMTAALEAYQRAIQEDSTFALAHLRLAVLAGWSPDVLLLRRPAVEAALRHRDRLSRRDRLWLDAIAVGMRADPAFEALTRRITERYPDDPEAWYRLGDLLFHGNPDRGRSVSEAREPLERALALDRGSMLDPATAEILHHLKDIALAEGRYADLELLAERMGEVRGPQYEALVKMLGRVGAGTAPERAAALAELPDMPPAGARFQLLLWTAPFGPAELLAALLDLHAEQSLALSPPQMPEWRRKGEAVQLAFWLGRISQGRAALEEMRRLDPDRAVLYEAWWLRAPFASATDSDLTRVREEVGALSPDTSPWPGWEVEVWRQVRSVLQGILSVRLGDMAAAERHARDVAALEAPDPLGALGRIGSHTVRAFAAQAQGRTDEALRLLEDVEDDMFGLSISTPATSYPPFTFQRFLRAELLNGLGRDEEALGWYPYDAAGLWLHGPMFVPLSHLRVAEIWDRKGNREKAAHHYHLFTLLWRDADPELRPMVDQVERRLAALARGRE
jgi:DNA-binding SARP family transcriptional activator/tetratricopeptide (TPR) repeat protein